MTALYDITPLMLVILQLSEPASAIDFSHKVCQAINILINYQIGKVSFMSYWY